MRKKLIYKNSGFTLVEIAVAALVFALSVAGLLSAISSLNRPAVESFEEVQAAYIAKGIAENLRKEVDATEWDLTQADDYGLEEGKTYQTQVTHNGIVFTKSYTVHSDATGGRWVDITVSWD